MKPLRSQAYKSEVKKKKGYSIIIAFIMSAILGFLSWNVIWYVYLSKTIAPKLEAIGVNYSPIINIVNAYKAFFSVEYANSDEYIDSTYYCVQDEENDICYTVRIPFYLFDRSYILGVQHIVFDSTINKDIVGESVEYNYPDKKHIQVFKRYEYSSEQKDYIETGASYQIDMDGNIERIIPIEYTTSKEETGDYEDMYLEYYDLFLNLDDLAKQKWGEHIFGE